MKWNNNRVEAEMQAFDRYKESLNEDTIDSIPDLKETIKDWLETIKEPFESYHKSIEELEYLRRDGFIPHSWNKGGLDLISITDIRSLVGSGYHCGLSIQDWVDDQYNEACENAIKEGLEDGTEEFYDHVDECTSSEYDAIAYRIRVMYEGESVLKIYTGYDKDAPYFRFKGKVDLDLEVNFKSIPELKKKLAKLTKKVEKNQ